MNKNIGDMTESELKDFIIELQEENSRYERKIKKYKEVIDKVYTRLEYYLIGNLKYKSSQEQFIKLLNVLKEVE